MNAKFSVRMFRKDLCRPLEDESRIYLPTGIIDHGKAGTYIDPQPQTIAALFIKRYIFQKYKFAVYPSLLLIFLIIRDEYRARSYICIYFRDYLETAPKKLHFTIYCKFFLAF